MSDSIVNNENIKPQKSSKASRRARETTANTDAPSSSDPTNVSDVVSTNNNNNNNNNAVDDIQEPSKKKVRMDESNVPTDASTKATTTSTTTATTDVHDHASASNSASASAVLNATQRKIRSDLMMRHGTSTNWHMISQTPKMNSIAARCLPDKNSGGRKAIMMAGKIPLVITGPPLPVYVANLHGLGGRSRVQGKYEENRYTLALRTNYCSQDTNPRFQHNDTDKLMMSLYPSLLEEQEAFYDWLNGPFLDLLAHHYVINFRSDEISRKNIQSTYSGLMKQLPWKSADDMKKIFEAINTKPLSVLELGDTETDRHAYELLKQMIVEIRNKAQYWVYNGNNKATPDAELDVHMVRFNTKVFWPTKDTVKGAAEALNARIAARLRKAKEMERARVAGLSDANATGHSADKPMLPPADSASTMGNIVSVDDLSVLNEAIELGEVDVVPMQQNDLQPSRAEVNIVISQYESGNPPAYRYHTIPYKTPAGQLIRRASAAAADQYVFRGDYVAPEFGATISKVSESIFFHLDLKSVLVIAHAPPSETVGQDNVVTLSTELISTLNNGSNSDNRIAS